MSKPQIVEVRNKRFMWEVVALDSTGHHRYSYWGKRYFPDEISAWVAAHNMLEQTDD